MRFIIVLIIVLPIVQSLKCFDSIQNKLIVCKKTITPTISTTTQPDITTTAQTNEISSSTESGLHDSTTSTSPKTTTKIAEIVTTTEANTAQTTEAQTRTTVISKTTETDKTSNTIDSNSTVTENASTTENTSPEVHYHHRLERAGPFVDGFGCLKYTSTDSKTVRKCSPEDDGEHVCHGKQKCKLCFTDNCNSASIGSLSVLILSITMINTVISSH